MTHPKSQPKPHGGATPGLSGRSERAKTRSWVQKKTRKALTIYLMCLESAPASLNMLPPPNTFFSVASAVMLRPLLSFFALMYLAVTDDSGQRYRTEQMQERGNTSGGLRVFFREFVLRCIFSAK
jgi:hypothetical protein